MHTDPIADMLTRIRNGIKAHHMMVTVPYSTIKENIIKVIKANNFIEDYAVSTKEKFKTLEITLKEGRNDLTLRRVSKPGQRIYIKNSDIKTVKNGLGILIVSTSKGVITNMEARKQNLGGEIICEIY